MATGRANRLATGEMNMFDWTEEQKLLRESVRRLARERIAPRAAAMDESQEFPEDVHRLFIEQGLLKLKIPQAYGGVPADCVTCCLVIEEIARVDGSSSLLLVNHLAGLAPFLTGSTDEQKARFLPAIVDGGHIVGFALTEPEAGSDAASLQTRAAREDKGYRLNGTKCFITNGGAARVFVLFATLDPALKKQGITTFLVEDRTPGVRVGKKEDKMGMRASPTTELILEDALVPEERRIGGEGEGWALLIGGLSETRILIAALSLGLADGATEVAARYATERSQFGKTIASFQGIQFMLADMLMGIETARSLVYRAARMQDEGDPLIRRYASMAKCYASDMAMRVTTDAVQMMGGYGYMKDYPVERMMRDAKVLQIFEGTNQIQRMIIARDYLANL
jgi:alkylation response protein AidB-like acyl-CoA dehydrogenase